MKTIESASTPYNDMHGTAAMDFHGSPTELYKYAEEKGIDLKKYNPIGITIYYGEIDFFSVSIICAINDNIEEYKTENDGHLPAVSIRIDETQKDFERRFKQLSITLGLLNYPLENYDIIKP